MNPEIDTLKSELALVTQDRDYLVDQVSEYRELLRKIKSLISRGKSTEIYDLINDRLKF